MESLVEIRVSTRILRLAGLVLNDGFWEFEQMNKMVETRQRVIVVFYGKFAAWRGAQSAG